MLARSPSEAWKPCSSSTDAFFGPSSSPPSFRLQFAAGLQPWSLESCQGTRPRGGRGGRRRPPRRRRGGRWRPPPRPGRRRSWRPPLPLPPGSRQSLEGKGGMIGRSLKAWVNGVGATRLCRTAPGASLPSRCLQNSADLTKPSKIQREKEEVWPTNVDDLPGLVHEPLRAELEVAQGGSPTLRHLLPFQLSTSDSVDLRQSGEGAVSRGFEFGEGRCRTPAPVKQARAWLGEFL